MMFCRNMKAAAGPGPLPVQCHLSRRAVPPLGRTTGSQSRPQRSAARQQLSELSAALTAGSGPPTPLAAPRFPLRDLAACGHLGPGLYSTLPQPSVPEACAGRAKCAQGRGAAGIRETRHFAARAGPVPVVPESRRGSVAGPARCAPAPPRTGTSGTPSLGGRAARL